jgi:hypothetical protein
MALTEQQKKHNLTSGIVFMAVGGGLILWIKSQPESSMGGGSAVLIGIAAILAGILTASNTLPASWTMWNPERVS